VTGSQLYGIGLEFYLELVGDDVEKYRDIVIRLVSDGEYLKELRRRLERARNRCFFFDTEGSTRELEKIFIQLVENELGNLKEEIREESET
jgi:predicted O-linked N-acetylglucosamine transferase (SPINDLY family)